MQRKDYYDEDLKNRLKRKLIAHGVVLVLVDAACLTAMVLSVVLSTHQNVALTQTIATLSSVLAFIFTLLFFAIDYIYLIKFAKLLSKFAKRRKVEIVGTFVKEQEKLFSIDGIQCHVYEFDVGQTHLAEPVSRNLYLEMSMEPGFEEGKRYSLQLVDNHILMSGEDSDHE